MKLKAYIVVDKSGVPFWSNGYTFIYLDRPPINEADQNLLYVTIKSKQSFIQKLWEKVSGVR